MWIVAVSHSDSMLVDVSGQVKCGVSMKQILAVKCLLMSFESMLQPTV
jgi:hypothetical protein